MSALAAMANFAWLSTSLGAATRFARALRNPAAVQAQWLERHLRRNAETAYGRAHHGRSIGNYQEFARRFPVVGYEELAPWCLLGPKLTSGPLKMSR